MNFTSSLLPLGIIKLISLSKCNIDILSFLLVNKQREFASRHDLLRPDCNALNIASLVWFASLPPLSIAALPDLKANELICIKASGLDSNITPITPIGTVFL